MPTALLAQNALSATTSAPRSEVVMVFSLPLDQRYPASIYGKELPNSAFLREGLAETLAILATRRLPSETQDIISAQERVTGIVHRLLNSDVDWQLWASLAYFLPTLAEAAPEAFLEAVDEFPLE